MGVDFFRRAVALVERVPPARPDASQHTIQTNGTLLTDEWCELFAEHEFLVGHQHRRPAASCTTRTASTSGARPTFDKVLRGLRAPADATASTSTSCARCNAANQDHPLEVYRFFRDDLGARYIQLIPIVERDNDTGFQEGDTVTDRSVDPDAWGRFLIDGVRRVGRARRRHGVRADVRRRARVLARLPAGACASSPRRAATPSRSSTTATSTRATTSSSPTTCSATSPRRTWSSCSRRRSSARSATPKRDTLPRYCRECDVRFACHGECPKNRFTLTPDGEPGLNYLCAGLQGVLHPHRRPRCGSWPTCCAAAATPTRSWALLAVRGPQRAVPVRQRPQGQALPPAARGGTTARCDTGVTHHAALDDVSA